MSRFTGDPEKVPVLGVDLYHNSQELWVARSELDYRISVWATTLDGDWLERALTYVSKVDGVSRTMPRGF